MLGILFAGSAAASTMLIVHLARILMSSAEYSHIAIVLPLSVVLIYLDRRAIFANLEPRFATGAGALTIIAGAMWGVRNHLAYVQPDTNLFVSVLLVVTFWIAGFWTCFGPSPTRKALFPLLFLFLLAPLPEVPMDKAVVALQKVSADVANILFNTASVPVIRRGQVFILINQQIEVAKECSGIRSSIVLFITALVFGHLFLTSAWSKVTLAATVVPLAIVKNGLRIFTLAVLGTYVDPGFLNGPLHHRGGVVFFAITLALVVVILLALRKLDRHSNSGHLKKDLDARRTLAETANIPRKHRCQRILTNN